MKLSEIVGIIITTFIGILGITNDSFILSKVELYDIVIIGFCLIIILQIYFHSRARRKSDEIKSKVLLMKMHYDKAVSNIANNAQINRKKTLELINKNRKKLKEQPFESDWEAKEYANELNKDQDTRQSVFEDEMNNWSF